MALSSATLTALSTLGTGVATEVDVLLDGVVSAYDGSGAIVANSVVVTPIAGYLSASASSHCSLRWTAADVITVLPSAAEAPTITGFTAIGMIVGAASVPLGFFGIGPVSRPSAYTQTYATADKTHAAPTAAVLTVTDGAGSPDNTIGAITADASVIAAVQEIADEINKLVADVADVKQVVNSLIDDLQALGLVT